MSEQYVYKNGAVYGPGDVMLGVVMDRASGKGIAAELNKLSTPDVFWMTDSEADEQHVDDNAPVTLDAMVDWRFPGDVFAVEQARRLPVGYYVAIPGGCVDQDGAAVLIARPATAAETEKFKREGCKPGSRMSARNEGGRE